MNIENILLTKLTDDEKFIREKVFIEEQGFSNEFDEIDEQSIHLLLYIDKKPVATGRLYKKMTDGENTEVIYAIGRVAVLPEYRKLHLGSKVLELLEEKAKEIGAGKIELSAQCAVREFYEKNGYVAKGDIYYDEFCPHIRMEKSL